MKLIIFPRDLNFVNQTILEIWLTILVSEMCISLLNIFFWIEEITEETITCTFPIHHGNTISVEDGYANFYRLWWLLSNIPKSYWIWVIGRIDFNPAFDDSLLLWTRFMINLTIFDWFIFKTLPFNTEVSVFKIDNCRPNKIISKYIIIIPYTNFEWRTPRKMSLKVIMLQKFWIWFIKLVNTSFIINFIITLQNQIRITGWAIISRA